MDIVFYSIRERKPIHNQLCWCEDEKGEKFIAVYCSHSKKFTKKENGEIVKVKHWTFML